MRCSRSLAAVAAVVLPVLGLAPAALADAPPADATMVELCVTVLAPPDLDTSIPFLVNQAIADGTAAIVTTTDCASPKPTATPLMHTVAGALSLYDYDNGFATEGEACSGEGGYSDIDGGMPVTVRDQAGTVIGTGTTEPGKGGSLGECVFAFTLVVPETDFYQFDLGRRGAPSYSLEEMKANDWKLDLSIGL